MQTKISRERMMQLCAQFQISPGARERALSGVGVLDLGDAGEFVLAETDDNLAGTPAAETPDMGDQVATLVERLMGSRSSSSPVARANPTPPTSDMGDRVADLVEQQLGRKVG